MKTLKFLFYVSFLLCIQNNSFGQNFFCPNGVRVVNGLDYEINIATNQIIFDLECDPCIYPDGGIHCQCTNNCSDVEPTAQDYADYHDCIDDCHDDYGDDPVYEDYCLDGCEYALNSEHRRCIEDCGDYVVATKTAESYAYAYELWWTTGLSETMNGQSDEFFISSIFDSRPLRIAHNSSQNFMNQTISYCINYEVFVQYDDGTCCRYVGSECVQKG